MSDHSGNTFGELGFQWAAWESQPNARTEPIRLEWWPVPREGESVPDHPYVDLTPYLAGGLSAPATPLEAVEAVQRYDEKLAEALAVGFTEAQWHDQLGKVTRWARARYKAVDIPGEALRLLKEFGEPTEPVQAERRRFMDRLRAAGVLNEEPD